VWLTDSLANLMSSMGIAGRDKAVSTQYTFGLLTQPQLENAYRGDWIARKVVDIPAQDATRAWRAWQADEKQINALEDEEKRHNLQRKLKIGLQRARLYGGSVLVMGVGTDSSEVELNVDKVKKGDLRFLHVLSRWEIRAGERETDLENPYYGEPRWYERSVVGEMPLRIHPSRVVRLCGAELPSYALAGTDGWGDSALQPVNDAVMAAGTVSQSVATMVSEAKVDVIKVPDFTKKISSQEYRDRLTTRFSYANTTKSVINALLLDAGEEWERINQDFTALPDVMKMYLLIASGAADIPATRMLGQSPAGLSSTGESDVRNYYDRVSSEQRTELQPALARLDEVLIRSALGSRKPEIHYNWHPLWQMSDKERADIFKTKADTFTIDVTSGLIEPAVLKEARENQLIEDGTYPGIEGIILEHEAQNQQEPDENDPEAMAQFALSKGLPAPGAVPGAAAGAGAGAAGVGGPEPQKQALNGTQITSLTALAELVQTEGLPKETVKAIIAASFPTLQEETINAIIDPIVPKKPEPIIPPAVGPDGKPLPPKPGEPKPGTPAPAQPKPGDNVVPIKKKVVGADGLTEDMKPLPLYVRRDVVNTDDIIAWAQAQGLDPVPAEELHVTILYSKTPVDWMKLGGYGWAGGDKDGILRIPPGGPRVVEPLGNEGAMVLSFACSELKWRHDDMVSNGASHDYDEYQAHVTITYKGEGVDLDTVEPYRGEIVLGPEIFEEITGPFDPGTLDAKDVLDAVTDVLEKQGRLVSDAMRAALESQPAPVVNVHLPQASDRKPVVKDMEYDEKNRVTRITEREEGDTQ
jgi:phage-related protein (TIGR01555 family)